VSLTFCVKIGTKLQWRGKGGIWFLRPLLDWLRKKYGWNLSGLRIKFTGCHGNCDVYMTNEFS